MIEAANDASLGQETFPRQLVGRQFVAKHLQRHFAIDRALMCLKHHARSAASQTPHDSIVRVFRLPLTERGHAPLGDKTRVDQWCGRVPHRAGACSHRSDAAFHRIGVGGHERAQSFQARGHLPRDSFQLGCMKSSASLVVIAIVFSSAGIAESRSRTSGCWSTACSRPPPGSGSPLESGRIIVDITFLFGCLSPVRYHGLSRSIHDGLPSPSTMELTNLPTGLEAHRTG